jgi:hypothetical protein
MPVSTRHKECSERRHQLFDVKVQVFFASAVATIQFVDRRVIDAESTVSGYEFVVDSEFGHGSHSRCRTVTFTSFTTM